MIMIMYEDHIKCGGRKMCYLGPMMGAKCSYAKDFPTLRLVRKIGSFRVRENQYQSLYIS